MSFFPFILRFPPPHLSHSISLDCIAFPIDTLKWKWHWQESFTFSSRRRSPKQQLKRAYLLFCTNHIVVYSLCCLVSAYTLEDVLWPISDLKKEKRGFHKNSLRIKRSSGQLIPWGEGLSQWWVFLARSGYKNDSVRPKCHFWTVLQGDCDEAWQVICIQSHAHKTQCTVKAAILIPAYKLKYVYVCKLHNPYSLFIQYMAYYNMGSTNPGQDLFIHTCLTFNKEYRRYNTTTGD